MENPPSPLDTLRQLKEMLDAGALTPTEFEALKQRLVFAPAASDAAGTKSDAASDTPTALPVAPPASVAPVPPSVPPAFVISVPPVAPPASGPEVWAANVPAAPLPTQPAFPEPNLFEPRPAAHVEKVDALVFEPVPQPSFMPEASADFPVAVGGPSYVEADALPENSSTDLPAVPAERSSSLGLVLAIGAVLVFLAVVAYLGFTRPASEHISSTSQTAADSVTTAIETGPQVAPLPATTAAPETVRVAPTNPAPVIRPRPAAAVPDSAAPAIKSPASDTSGNH